MSTARGLIEAYRLELRDEDLSPSRAAEVLQRLTALLGNVLSEIREAEASYNLVLLNALDTDEAANRATIRAKITPEYARSREAQDTHKVLLEMIRSLKVVLKSQQEEMRLSR